jgi:hypothetical protein
MRFEEFSRSHSVAALGMVLSNNALQRTVVQRGPRLSAAQPSWPAAELGR